MKNKYLFLLIAALFFFFQETQAQMSGTYSIGYGGGDDYQTLYQALQALQTNGVDDAVIFELSTDYNPTPEAYPIYIQPYTGANEINTLTIRPASGTTHIIERDLMTTGSAIFAVIDGSHFILDGSNNGTDSRDLTVSSIGADAETGAIALLESVTAGTNITIKNCILKAGSKEYETTGIYSENFTDVHFENNKIYNARIGVITFGNDVSVINNEIGSDNSGEYLHYGISAQFGSDITISGNTIYNLIDDQDFDAVRAIAANDLTGDVLISNNFIDNLIHTGNNVVQAMGFSDCTPTNMQIINNRISNIASNSFTDNFPAGIAINCPAMTTGMKIMYNSVNIPQNTTHGTGTGDNNTMAGGININGGTGITLKNNIISNTLGERDGAVYITLAAAILVNMDNSPFAENDYNLFYADGNNDVVSMAMNTSGAMDLSQWQTWTGGGANSFEGEPLFTSDDDLNLQACSPAVAHATDIPEVTTDIEANTRDTQYPTMGAYEYEKIQAENINFFGLDKGAIGVAWEVGTGCKSAVFMKQRHVLPEKPAPVNGTTYAADTNFGAGDEIGSSGWYCVFNDNSENFVLISGNVGEYTFMVCEYFGGEGNEIYLTESAMNNPIEGYLVNIDEIKFKIINIHPNPTNGKFIVEIDGQLISNNQITGINIIDITGKEILQVQNISQERFEIDLSGFGKGLYFIKINSKDGVYTEKLILK
ncbi:MAG: T9SS type A sorting domain-containing protein [Bacteroidales bacterium]|nr:T9SS type A sorting domain-containing protein [Bacteroidales bacterium]